MLVLKRKLGESIVIGGEIIIKLLSVSQGQARLGIEAPREISVHRQEIYELLLDKHEKARLGSALTKEESC